MSLPTLETGKLHLPPHIHAFLEAESDVAGTPMVTLAARYVVDAIERKIHVVSLANSKHKSRGYGEILKGKEGQ